MAAKICPACAELNCAQHKRAKPTAAQAGRRKAYVAHYIGTNGMYCPGYMEPGHLVTPPNILTADHIESVANGGSEDGPLQAYCRRCNGRKSNNPDIPG